MKRLTKIAVATVLVITLYYAASLPVCVISMEVERNLLHFEYYYYSYNQDELAMNYLAEAMIQWYCRDFLIPYGPFGYAYCILINS